MDETKIFLTLCLEYPEFLISVRHSGELGSTPYTCILQVGDRIGIGRANRPAYAMEVALAQLQEGTALTRAASISGVTKDL
jgi:hypothetical protein